MNTTAAQPVTNVGKGMLWTGPCSERAARLMMLPGIVMDFRHNPQIIEEMKRVGYQESTMELIGTSPPSPPCSISSRAQPCSARS